MHPPLIAIAHTKNHPVQSTPGFNSSHVLLDGIREFCEHRLAADLNIVVPYADEDLRLERVRKDVGVALHLHKKHK